MSNLAPILIFAYRRPEHLRKTISSLMRCEGFLQSPVIIYADGAKNQGEIPSVMATREVAENLLGDRAEYHFSDINLGLSQSIITGVTDIVNRYGRVIVLEDDLELSPAFLNYMNQALDQYADDENIFQISGYMFEVEALTNMSSAFFLPLTVSWGWATWKSAWDRFDSKAVGWEELLSSNEMRQRFNLDGAYDYTTMLSNQMAGNSDSWAIRWYWSVFKKNGLALFPPVSLVRNTGFDGSGTHGKGVFRKFSGANRSLPSPIIHLPEKAEVNKVLFKQVKKALWLQNGGWISSVVDFFRPLLKGKRKR